MINNEVKQRVKSILEVNKDAKDCDRLLISIIWEQDSSHIENKKEFLAGYTIYYAFRLILPKRVLRYG